MIQHHVNVTIFTRLGLMLSFVLIRYHDLGRIKADLYIKNFSMREYYDKIVLNYKDKLPLVFGKWNLLKRNLKELAVYNLDIVIDKEIHSNLAASLSVNLGGNKELFEGIKETAIYNNKLMSSFAAEGMKVLKDYILNRGVPSFLKSHFSDINKLNFLCIKLEEVSMLLNPTTYFFRPMSLIRLKIVNIKEVLRKIEGLFAEEITAYYYMNLCHDWFIRISNFLNYYNSDPIEESLKILKSTPKNCLSLILKEDNLEPFIRDWFQKCKTDLVAFPQDVLENTNRQMALE
jgi:hypothetical protein